MFKITARVIKGQGNGKLIGFSTINLELIAKSIEFRKLDYGVYACKVKILQNKELPTTNYPLQTYVGALHFGKRETMNLPESIEIHLLNFKDMDLYDAEVEVEVLEKIRDIVKFNSIDELKEQISKDIEKIKKQC